MHAPTLRFSIALGAAVSLGGCDAGEDDLAEASRAAPVAVASPDGPDPERCEEVTREADALIADAMICGDDTDCQAELGTLVTEDPCLPHLACWLAVSTDDRARLGDVLDRLQELDAMYRQACGVCPVATCADPQLVSAECSHRGCALDVAPEPDDIATLATVP